MATELRRRIVRLRVKGWSVPRIAAAVGKGASTVRYHLWMDATDPEDRGGGFYGKEAKRSRRRAERRTAGA